MSIQNEVKLLQTGADLLQIRAAITNIVVGSFLLKLKTITINFENNIFSKYLEGQRPWASLLLEVLEVATR